MKIKLLFSIGSPKNTVILLQKTVRLQHLEVSRQNRTCTERNRHCFESLVSHCNTSRILFFSLTLHWLWFSFYRYSKRTVEMSYNGWNKAYIRPNKRINLMGSHIKYTGRSPPAEGQHVLAAYSTTKEIIKSTKAVSWPLNFTDSDSSFARCW